MKQYNDYTDEDLTKLQEKAKLFVKENGDVNFDVVCKELHNLNYDDAYDLCLGIVQISRYSITDFINHDPTLKKAIQDKYVEKQKISEPSV